MPTITVSDIKLLASTRMTDTTDGGGQMTGSALQDGAENNVFPDVAATDRAFGRLALRKVWPAVLNVGTDTLMGAHVVLDDMPDDANVKAWAMLGTGQNEDRAGALARLQQSHWEPLGPTGLRWATAPHLLARIKSAAGTVPLSVGSVVYALQSGGAYADPVLITSIVEVVDGSFAEGFPSTDAGDRVFAVTYDGTITAANVGATYGARLGVPGTVSPRVIGTRPVTGALAIGDTFCDVDTLLAALVPVHLGSVAGVEAQIGIDASAVLPSGRAAAFRMGDGLVIHHTDTVAAAVYANGNTINCGRGGLASVRVVDSAGVSIPAGWTADLAAGTVTVTDISGWAQPVTVRHTIEEVVGCARTGYPEVMGGASSAPAGSGVVTQSTAPFTLSRGLAMYCGRTNVGTLRVASKTGQDITSLTYSVNDFVGPGVITGPWFTLDPAAGTVTFSNADAVDAARAAFIASHSPVTLVSGGSYVAPSAYSSAAQATLNRLTFNRALTKAFPAGTLVSSMLLLGDLQARAGASFAQESWTAVWADARIGSAIIPQYQQAAHPIVVNNAGAISERWAIIFLTASTFRVVGETLGQIATGDVNSVLSPINPATGQPYFTLAETGWGAGWAGGHVLRFNTGGANAPVWVARAVLPSAPSATPDSLTIAVRGDIDA